MELKPKSMTQADRDAGQVFSLDDVQNLPLELRTLTLTGFGTGSITGKNGTEERDMWSFKETKKCMAHSKGRTKNLRALFGDVENAFVGKRVVLDVEISNGKAITVFRAAE
jgi:hypothetical protein